jgi:glycogen debranching enzyme
VTPVAAATAGTDGVTVLDGASFFRSNRNGDVSAARAQGLFVMDTRVISRWELLVDDQPLESLGVLLDSAFAATLVTRTAIRPGNTEPTVVVERYRMIADDGVREDIVVRNYGIETLGAALTLEVDADFADLFAVKEGRPRSPGPVGHHAAGENLEFSVRRDEKHRGVRVLGHGARATGRVLAWQLTVPGHEEWRTSIEVLPSSQGEEADPPFPIDRPVETAEPSRRLRDWRAAAPVVDSESPLLQAVLERSIEDLGALRIADPEHPDLDVVAAGAPWFMALFGRDSLITSWLMLGWDLDLARGTLHTLARLQGTHVDLLSEQEPGRILHEVRLGMTDALGGSSIYFGSVDATPLFVMVLDAAEQWGLPAEDVAALLPAADRALRWVEQCGDLDGDGFVEYQRKTDRGLRNQGWKDSEDAITFRDGRPAHGPIALAEVQGYVYAAYRARARLAQAAGDVATAASCIEHAAELRAHFDAAFWLPELGYYALALDGDKQPVDALASNQGHCLWTGLAADSRVDSLVAHLLSPEMFSGWGVRTLATSAAAYNPVSYHNGSVWPHDNALLVAGLMRTGQREAATQIATALLDAAAHFGGRLPELFCGFDRAQLPLPVPYPTSCSPQAWAAAAPVGLLTALLGLSPDREEGTISVAATVPGEWGRLRISGLSVGDRRANVDTDDALSGA